MTRANISKLLSLLATAYPNTRIDASQMTINLWQEMLADMPDALVVAATKRLIAVSPYPPAISDIRKQAVEAMAAANGVMDGQSAWGVAIKAIHQYGYYNESEALASMSPEVRRVVERFGWRELCTSDVGQASIIRAQFIKAYDAIINRRKEDAQIPAALHDTLRNLADKMQLRRLDAAKEEI